jgi:enterochelin esterase family protein
MIIGQEFAMAIDLVERVRNERNPLIDGQSVTFVWQGETAPRLIADYNGWEYQGGAELERVAGKVWALRVDLPEDTYMEYAFLMGEERVKDPFNPRRVTNGMGKMNHFFYMPGAQPPTVSRRQKGVPRGAVTSEMLNVRGFAARGARRTYFYQPPVASPSPLLVVWDGQDYLRRAHLTTIVDNLIHEGRIRPVALAMPEHGGQARLLEYGCSEITLGFLKEFVLPAARQRLNLIDIQAEPGSYGVMGASMGGLMALYTGLRIPGIFGRVLSQSGAFSFPDFDFVIWDLVRHSEPGSRKVWMDVGTMEWLTETNRRMKALLDERGFALSYHEYHGGHNYTSWQRELVAGLAFLFPPLKD